MVRVMEFLLNPSSWSRLTPKSVRYVQAAGVRAELTPWLSGFTGLRGVDSGSARFLLGLDAGNARIMLVVCAVGTRETLEKYSVLARFVCGFCSAYARRMLAKYALITRKTPVNARYRLTADSLSARFWHTGRLEFAASREAFR